MIGQEKIKLTDLYEFLKQRESSRPFHRMNQTALGKQFYEYTVYIYIYAVYTYKVKM